MTKDKALNVASQCLATTSAPLCKNILVGGGSGLLSELFSDAAKAIEALAQPADNPYGYDWSMLEAAQESLREHMARIKELEAQLAQPAQEPVAYVTGMSFGSFIVEPLNPAKVLPIGMALYSSPQKKNT